MMTISKNISHTGPVEISADLLTIISGGGEDDNPASSKGNTKINGCGNEDIMFIHIEHKFPINDNVNFVVNTTADTTRGVTSGMLSLELKY